MINATSKIAGLNVTAADSVSGKRWKFRTDDERMVLLLQQRFGISDILARIMVGRGVSDENADAFLNPSLKESLPDPLHMKDMLQAVECLSQAVKQGHKIGIFGDYDVDGATSSALLRRYFSALNIPTETYIPDRHKEGYGPNLPAFFKLQEQGCKLIITVDCGAVAFDALAGAKKAGLDVIVLDHHVGAAQLPEAVAVVNPNRLDEDSPCTYLAAVGVVFMTLIALNRHLREAGYFKKLGKKDPNLMTWLDIVALGTVCDVVPLKGVNRALVSQGIKVMAGRRNTGIRTIVDMASVQEKLSTYHAGFVIGPRINAGGRVGQSHLGSELLASDNESQVQEIAKQLEQYNAERKAIEMLVLEQAMAQAERQVIEGRSFLMVADEGWHEGVIGIVAGRIKDRFDLPTAVLSMKGEIAKASARSVSGVDLGSAVSSARDENMLIAGGGHAMAAGFSVATAGIPDLHNYYEKYIGEALRLYKTDRYLSVDAVVSSRGVTADLAHELEKCAPYGMGNPSPKLVIYGVRVKKLDILKEQHIRAMVQGSEGGSFVKVMAFRSIGTPLGEMLLEAKNGRKMHLAGSLKLNYWQNRERVDFHIDDAAWA